MIQVVLGLYAAAFFLTKEMLYNGVYEQPMKEKQPAK